MTRDALLSAIYAEPTNDAPRAVFADWLLEQGDPQGEFLQLQLARARGKKGTGAKERRLFDPTWWPEHPIQKICGAVEFRHVARGFPEIFSPGFPVADGEAQRQAREWKVHAGLPGWATVRVIDGFMLDSKELGQVIAQSPLPQLRRLAGIGPRTLAELRKTTLHVEELAAFGTRVKKLPRLGAAPKLRRLEWSSHDRGGALPGPLVPLNESLARVRELGVLDVIRELSVGGHRLGSLVMDPLELFKQLPAHIELLEVQGSDVNHAAVHRDGTLVLHLNEFSVEAVADHLSALSKKQVKRVRVEFDEAGYFTKKNRPAAMTLIRNATKHFAERELELGP